MYHEIESDGFISYTDGNKRIQIVTDDRIFFYEICAKTLLPIIDNAMNNYIKVTHMIIGK